MTAETGTSFYTLTYLQGSQTCPHIDIMNVCFIPLLTYKALKHFLIYYISLKSFIPLLTYKALKLQILHNLEYLSFIPLLTYKALKLIFSFTEASTSFIPLLTYKALKPQIILRLSPNQTYWHMRKYSIRYNAIVHI